MNEKYADKISVEQAAEMLQVGRSTIYRYLADTALGAAKTATRRGTMLYRDKILKWYF